MNIRNWFEKSTKKPLFERIPWLNSERAEYVIYLARDSKERIQLGEIVVENRLSQEMENEYIVITTRTRIFNPNYIEEVNVFSDRQTYRPCITHAILHINSGEIIQVKGE